MNMNVYAIYDTAAGMYMRPFFCVSDGQANRMFADIVMDADHDVGKHPEDYSLARIGRYNDQNGKLDDEDTQVLATSLAVVAGSRNVERNNLDLFDKGLPGNGEELRK